MIPVGFDPPVDVVSISRSRLAVGADCAARGRLAMKSARTAGISVKGSGTDGTQISNPPMDLGGASTRQTHGGVTISGPTIFGVKLQVEPVEIRVSCSETHGNSDTGSGRAYVKAAKRPSKAPCQDASSAQLQDRVQDDCQFEEVRLTDVLNGLKARPVSCGSSPASIHPLGRRRRRHIPARTPRVS